jgi:hypothetical protein
MSLRRPTRSYEFTGREAGGRETGRGIAGSIPRPECARLVARCLPGTPKRLIETEAAILAANPSTVQAKLLNRHHSRE